MIKNRHKKFSFKRYASILSILKMYGTIPGSLPPLLFVAENMVHPKKELHKLPINYEFAKIALQTKKTTETIEEIESFSQKTIGYSEEFLPVLQA